MGCDVVTVSTDTEFVHLAWKKSEKELANVRYLMASDRTGRVSRQFGVYDEDTGHALRGTFLINPEGVVVHETTNFLPVGRSTKEALRTLKAFQFVAAHGGDVCPANWDEGQDTMKETPEGAAEFLSSH